jgi:hypothetical protein
MNSNQSYSNDNSNLSLIYENSSVGARIGCWLLIISQHFGIQAIVDSGLPNNTLMLVLLNELIFLVFAQRMAWLGLVRDMLDLSFYSLIIGLLALIGFWSGKLLDIPAWKPIYNNAIDYLPVFTYFILMTVSLRLLWAFKSAKTGRFYRWPKLGPITYYWKQGDDGTEEPYQYATAGALVILVTFFAFSIWLAAQPEKYYNAIIGSTSILLFLKFFYPHFKTSIIQTEDVVKNKILLEEAAKLTADLITENNHASETLDLVVEENNMLRRHMTETEEDFRRRFSPEQIDYLHKFSNLDEGLKDQISGILHQVWLAQQAKNESATPPPDKPQRPKPKLALVPETGKNLPDKD